MGPDDIFPKDGMMYCDNNGEWKPITSFNGDEVITGTIELSEEAEAAFWALSQGGIEIVPRGDDK